MNDLPRERFTRFVDSLLAGKDLEKALLETYGDRLKDFGSFEKRFARFTK